MVHTIEGKEDVVYHLQENLWPDNKAPGTRDDCGPEEAYGRILYILRVILKFRRQK